MAWLAFILCLDVLIIQIDTGNPLWYHDRQAGAAKTNGSY